MAGANLFDLMERVVDLLVRLVGEEAARTRRQAAWFAGGVVLLGLAVAFVAGAAALALAPLVGSRAIALVTVAVPLALAGRVLLQRGIAGAATDERDRQRDHRQHQQHMHPRAGRIAAQHPEQPRDHEEGRQ
jgi:hypothetical protein